MNRKILTLTIVFIMLTASYAQTSEIVVASGAGFRKMVVDVSKTCEKDYGVKMNMSFGNLGQVIAQIKNTGLVEAVIGDERFLSKAGPEFAESHLIGKGKLVLIWRKGLDIKSVEDITTDKVGKLAIPNLQKAIYGRAGSEFLASKGMTEAVKDKLLVVATVPQVTSYIVTGEVDAGFSNLTDTLGSLDKIGGYILIEDGYKEINIITGIIKGFENTDAAAYYRRCITSAEVKEIAKKHGM
ncbi:molybdenum ABC transporter, periplasmic molybdate-binding protein [Denitrovibrio acetiphilus DSM 12809]|uniref:Molybdenum ABC transporter, periplasmic molybdate-binding protein n=1 Tax=Denitrovibrio acetiphilus (strain DSM 12809 / NBRC 114555 / N2460) TaxID=522772 RepID=D4H511_DENA2|nr:molybdate ABC transporter substrate-binding protein [Denitrovibrio acetiphilus]ADD69367.1 molybdenum ABC transporter, periplasmic molybdate-binding protein [Denitrovibrio acetiphilus DSM 12809]